MSWFVAATACWPPIIWSMLTYDTKPMSESSTSAAPVPMESFCNPRELHRALLERDRPEHEQAARVDAKRARLACPEESTRYSGVRQASTRRRAFRSPVELGGDEPRRHLPGRSPDAYIPACASICANTGAASDPPATPCSAIGLRLVEAQPDSRDDLRGHAHEPDVRVVVGRARLAGDGHALPADSGARPSRCRARRRRASCRAG